MLRETITAEYSAVRQRLLDGWTVTIKGDPVTLHGCTDHLVYREVSVWRYLGWKLIADEEAVCTKEWKVRGKVVRQLDSSSRLEITLSVVDTDYLALVGKTVEITVVDK